MTYLLKATKNPFYLRVGQAILESLNLYARAPCGYATLHSVIDKSQEDRMESFFLSETCKYLYLVCSFSLTIASHSLIVNFLLSSSTSIIQLTRMRKGTCSPQRDTSSQSLPLCALSIGMTMK